jgi:uridine kinase
MNQPFIVGITGGSASGKTSILRDIKSHLPTEAVSVVSQDNYYKPIEEQQSDEQGKINFDLPTSINRAAFFHDLMALKEGKTLHRLEYTFNNKDKEPEIVEVKPAPIVIIEGLFIFYFEEIRNQIDLKVYIDAKDEVKLQRRLKRDSEERGYTADVVQYQWNNHVLPSYYQYLRPFRDDVDLIITNNEGYQKGLDVLIAFLKDKVEQKPVKK